MLLGNRQFRGSEGVWCLEQLVCAICQKHSPPPPTSLEGVNSPLGHTHFIRLSFPQLNVQILPYDYTQTGLQCLDIRLQGNFPVSQVAGCRCTLLTGNSSISLARSEEQINFLSNLPKCLKWLQKGLFMLSCCF